MERFDAFAQASIAEFLNLVNGLFAVNCSHEGVEMDLLPSFTEQNVGFGGIWRSCAFRGHERGSLYPLRRSGNAEEPVAQA